MQSNNGGAPCCFGKQALNNRGFYFGSRHMAHSCHSHLVHHSYVSLCSRVWVSFLTGCLVGCSGLTGFRGFGFYLLAHALVRMVDAREGVGCHVLNGPALTIFPYHTQLGALLFAKTGGEPAKYFPTKCAGSGGCWRGCVRGCLPVIHSIVTQCKKLCSYSCASLLNNAHRYTIFTSNILAQSELLTFVLFWTLSNNIVYLF